MTTDKRLTNPVPENLTDIRELLSEFEQRISCLENSRSCPEYIPDIKEEPDWNRQQWDYVLQMRARLLYLENKVVDLYKKKRRHDIL